MPAWHSSISTVALVITHIVNLKHKVLIRSANSGVPTCFAERWLSVKQAAVGPTPRDTQFLIQSYSNRLLKPL